MPIHFSLQKKFPEEQLLQLYNAHQWYAYTKHPEQLHTALLNSTYVVSAWADELLVGLARAISDDVSIFYLQDILVLPDYEGKGIGQSLLKHCLERFAHVRQKVLMTDNDARVLQFYKQQLFRNVKEMEQINVFIRLENLP